MKPEPLKQKKMEHTDYFQEQDIKSAVEWLKKEQIKLDKLWMMGKLDNIIYGNRIAELINKAFEDVIKK